MIFPVTSEVVILKKLHLENALSCYFSLVLLRSPRLVLISCLTVKDAMRKDVTSWIQVNICSFLTCRTFSSQLRLVRHYLLLIYPCWLFPVWKFLILLCLEISSHIFRWSCSLISIPQISLPAALGDLSQTLWLLRDGRRWPHSDIGQLCFCYHLPFDPMSLRMSSLSKYSLTSRFSSENIFLSQALLLSIRIWELQEYTMPAVMALMYSFPMLLMLCLI